MWWAATTHSPVHRLNKPHPRSCGPFLIYFFVEALLELLSCLGTLHWFLNSLQFLVYIIQSHTYIDVQIFFFTFVPLPCYLDTALCNAKKKKVPSFRLYTPPIPLVAPFLVSLGWKDGVNVESSSYLCRKPRKKEDKWAQADWLSPPSHQLTHSAGAATFPYSICSQFSHKRWLN